MNGHSDADVDHQVEIYRRKLCLKTWEDQAAWAANLGEYHGVVPSGRRSGRTTRGLLRAIARAQLDDCYMIAVDAKPMANMEECLRIGRNLILWLGLFHEISIVPDHHGIASREACVGYVDHHNEDI